MITHSRNLRIKSVRPKVHFFVLADEQAKQIHLIVDVSHQTMAQMFHVIVVVLAFHVRNPDQAEKGVLPGDEQRSTFAGQVSAAAGRA